MIESEAMHSPEVHKPVTLFHASQKTDIQRFDPRAERVRDPEEGPVVFATPDRAYASCFIVPTDDSLTQISRYGEGENWKVIVRDRAMFESLDRGGAIYALPSTNFYTDPDKNMAGTEWVSKEAVTPSDVEVFESGLVAMQRAGVDVYFVELATWDLIKASNDHGYGVVRGLLPEPTVQ